VEREESHSLSLLGAVVRASLCVCVDRLVPLTNQNDAATQARALNLSSVSAGGRLSGLAGGSRYATALLSDERNVQQTRLTDHLGMWVNRRAFSLLIGLFVSQDEDQEEARVSEGVVG